MRPLVVSLQDKKQRGALLSAAKKTERCNRRTDKAGLYQTVHDSKAKRGSGGPQERKRHQAESDQWEENIHWAIKRGKLISMPKKS